MTGAVYDTYVAALQHDNADLPEGTRKVGVVRRPTSWFHGAVDENRPELGPPADLLEAFQDREEAFKVQGMCEEGAHNGAWDEVAFDERYREHLASEPARSAVEDLLALLESGTDVALVCFENTDQKRCHRTALREHLEARL